MTQPKRILVVEIRTEDNPGIDSSQLSMLTAHREKGRIYLDSIDTIKSAVIDGIVHLGSNFRHPLLFDVQVVPGDELDAAEPNPDKPPSKSRRRRKRRSNSCVRISFLFCQK